MNTTAQKWHEMKFGLHFGRLAWILPPAGPCCPKVCSDAAASPTVAGENEK